MIVRAELVLVQRCRRSRQAWAAAGSGGCRRWGKGDGALDRVGLHGMGGDRSAGRCGDGGGDEGDAEAVADEVAGVLASVPEVAGEPARGRVPLGCVVRSPGPTAVLLAAFAFELSHMSVFTYVAPVLTRAGLGNQIGAVLLVFGMSAMAGLWVTGLFIDRHLRALALGSLTLFALVMAALVVTGTAPVIVPPPRRPGRPRTDHRPLRRRSQRLHGTFLRRPPQVRPCHAARRLRLVAGSDRRRDYPGGLMLCCSRYVGQRDRAWVRPKVRAKCRSAAAGLAWKVLLLPGAAEQ